MKDRRHRLELAEDVAVEVTRSSTHPVEYAIVLLARRDGAWHAVRTFDNAHEPTEHHDHAYRGARKMPPTVTHGPVNDAMHAALSTLRERWSTLVQEWDTTR